jgi:hypothetical protein
MGRKAEPGILFYRMNCGHTRNRKIRLLVNEFKGTGYWIWQCILDHAYEGKGYYFDYNKEDLEWFAADVCKESLELVEKVIDCCLRRGLFDKRLYEQHRILTSRRMQAIYLDATAERRRKGTEVEMFEEDILITFPEDTRNISIVPRNNLIPPRNNSIDPGQNPQRRVEESKGKERKVYPTGGAPAEPSPPVKGGKKGGKGKADDEPEPYWDLLVKVWFDFGIEKFGVKPSFEGKDPKIFKSIIGRLKKRALDAKVEWNETIGPQRLRYFLDSAFSEAWLKENFLLTNLEKQFDKVIQNQTARAKQVSKAEKSDIQYLYDRYLEEGLKLQLVTADHYDQLVGRKIMANDFYESMVPRRIRNLTGSNQANELRLLQAYQEGKDTDERRADVPVLKQLAVIDAFAVMSKKGFKAIPHA